jgi:hypothetical protein
MKKEYELGWAFSSEMLKLYEKASGCEITTTRLELSFSSLSDEEFEKNKKGFVEIIMENIGGEVFVKIQKDKRIIVEVF